MAKGRTTKRTPGTARDYPRTLRLNQLLREIIADELERLDDERLELLTVVSVEAEPDMRRAIVFYDNLEGEEGDAMTLEALADNRRHLQAAVARQARTKRTPELTFKPDPSIRSAARIDAILRDIEPGTENEGEGEGEGGAGIADEPGRAGPGDAASAAP
jgi:ribosome-binding factor A